MYVAQEVWWSTQGGALRAWGAKNHLPFAAMVDASPHTVTTKLAAAQFYQSLTMVQAINHAHGGQRLRELVMARAAEQVSETAAFSWAIGGGAEAQDAAWSNAVINQAVMGGFLRDWQEPSRPH